MWPRMSLPDMPTPIAVHPSMYLSGLLSGDDAGIYGHRGMRGAGHDDRLRNVRRRWRSRGHGDRKYSCERSAKLPLKRRLMASLAEAACVALVASRESVRLA